MSDRPDFIVDPSGNARDTRGEAYSQTSQGSSSQGPPKGPPVYYSSSPSTAGGGGGSKRPSGVIFIPIGLILTLIMVVVRMMAGAWQNNTASTSQQGNLYSEASANALNMGVYYYNRGEYDKAIVHFNLALAEEPEMAEAYNDRALAYEALGENDLALADLNKAIQLDPQGAYAYSNRGALYLSLGEQQQSLADLDKAIALDARLAKAYQNRGLTHMDLGNLEQAIADFSKAIELTPEFIFMMQSTEQSRSTQEENSLFLDIIQQDMLNSQSYADLPKSYASRAMAYLQQGQLELAGADLVKARQLGVGEDIAGPIEALLTLAGYTVMPGAGGVETPTVDFSNATGPGIAPAEPTARPAVIAPKTGHWEGVSERGGYQGEVSFDVDGEGILRNFSLTMNFGLEDDTCRVIKDVVPVNADHAFSLVFGMPSGEGINVISGKFESDSTILGQSSQSIQCWSPKGEQIQSMLPEGGRWSANWIGPLGTP